MRLASLMLLLLLSAGCGRETPEVYSYPAMSTIIEISLWGDGRIADKVFCEIKKIEDKFSYFKEDSEISKLNNGLLQEMSPECKYLIKESLKYKELTDGVFDINYRSDRKYDLGGIVKGYAADKAAEILKKNNIKRAMVNIGGNLYLIGYPPGKKFWKVGIKNPKNPDSLIGYLKLDINCGVSTSGNYERPGHIVNPKTGKPVQELLSVTITAPTAMEADALSTGVFVMGKKKGMELIEKLPEVEGVIVDEEGVYVSSGLKDKYEPRNSFSGSCSNI